MSKKAFLRVSILSGALLGSSASAMAADAIITQTVNFRAGPGTIYVTRGAIPAGNHVDVRICRKNWCQISYDRRTGWIAANFIAFNQRPVTYQVIERRPVIRPHNSLRVVFAHHIWHSYDPYRDCPPYYCYPRPYPFNFGPYWHSRPNPYPPEPDHTSPPDPGQLHLHHEDPDNDDDDDAN